MSLPKLAVPTHSIMQPSTNNEIKFRPWLVKEEKILLMAKQSNNIKDIFQTMKDILKACCLEKTFDVNNCPIFDLEIMFLRLRAVSINNIEKITVTDAEDKKEYQLAINFNEIEAICPKVVDKNIQIGGNLIIRMKYPNASIYQDDKKEIIEHINKNNPFDLIVECVDKIFQKDAVLSFNKEELKEFLDNLEHKTYEKIKEFISNIPKVEYKINYKNSLGNDRFIRFDSIIDFFLFL